MSSLNERIVFEMKHGELIPNSVNTFIDQEPAFVSVILQDDGLFIEVRLKDLTYVSDVINLQPANIDYCMLDLESNTFQAFGATESLGIIYLGDVGLAKLVKLEKQSRRIVRVGSLVYILILISVLAALISLNA